MFCKKMFESHKNVILPAGVSRSFVETVIWSKFQVLYFEKVYYVLLNVSIKIGLKKHRN